LHLIADTLHIKDINICKIQWKVTFGKTMPGCQNEHNHEYTNLLSEGALARFHKGYMHKRHVMIIMAIMFLVLLIMGSIKYIYPEMSVPADIVNIFSLLIGAVGLYLAAVSQKDDKKPGTR